MLSAARIPLRVINDFMVLPPGKCFVMESEASFERIDHSCAEQNVGTSTPPAKLNFSAVHLLSLSQHVLYLSACDPLRAYSRKA